MATTNGMNRFRGSLSDFVFYTRGKKQVVRKKSTDYKLSENSIKSGRDFGEAIRNATYLRKAFDILVKNYGNDDFHNRLNQRFTRIFKSISSTQLGNKRLSEGNLSLLAGFQFNNFKQFNSLCLARLEINIDPAGSIEFKWLTGAYETFVKSVPHATQAYIQMMVFHYDLDGGGQYESIRLNDLVIHLDRPVIPKASLKLPLDHRGEKALIVATGIYFHTKNSRSYDKRYFACKISHALHLKDGVEVSYVKPDPEKTEQQEDGGVGEWEV